MKMKRLRERNRKEEREDLRKDFNMLMRNFMKIGSQEQERLEHLLIHSSKQREISISILGKKKTIMNKIKVLVIQ